VAPKKSNIRQADPAGRASLGIYTNAVHAGQKPSKYGHSGRKDAINATRRIRFQLQRAAQGLLPQERVAHCMRSTLNANGVQVLISAKGASLGNLSRCGSIWQCPICAAKITEGRRQELQQAINIWVAKDGEVYLMSLTFPHQVNQGLKENLKLFSNALRKFKNSRLYKNIMAEIGSAGSVRALEVTHGINGWHPHTHDLVFARKDQLHLLQRLQSAWIDMLIKVGLADRSQMNDMMQAAFDVRNGDYSAQYVAKFGYEPAERSKTMTDEHWGAARELTKSHAKVGKSQSGRTPFMLLRDFIEGDQDAGALFQEFSLHFKGKCQLFWSRNLRKALALPKEKSDIEMAETAEIAERADSAEIATIVEITETEALALPERELVYVLESESWSLVLSRNARCNVLETVEEAGADGVAALLTELAGRHATHQGGFCYQEFGGLWYNKPYWVEL